MSISISVDLDNSQVMSAMEAMPRTVAAEIEKAMVLSTHVAEAEIKALTPRKTGRLFSGWEPSTRGYGFDIQGRVVNHVGYAGYIEDGTKPHEIVAHGGALVIPVGGRTLSGRARKGSAVMFRKKVRHPGFLGRHMARLGLAAARPAILQEFHRAVKDAVRLALGK